MAKTTDKNKVLLTISAILIVIAIIITCVAAIYERSQKGANHKSEVISGADGPVASTTIPTSSSTAAPQTTTPQTTTPVNNAKNKAGKYKVVTKDDPLGIRITAAQDAERVSEIPKGGEVEILAVYDTWGYVNYNGVSGWVSMNYVELIAASTEVSTHTTGKHKIATKDDPLGIRTKPEQDAQRSGEIPKGAEVEILAVCGDWGYVKYENTSGWLSYKYLEKVS